MDKEIGLLGLAFKPNTDDMREASSLVLTARLLRGGRARARLRPGRRGGGAQAASAASTFKDSAEAVVEGADAVVLVTEWPEFAELDLARDGAARCAASCWSTGATCSTRRACASAGLVYEGVGRSAGRAATVAGRV